MCRITRRSAARSPECSSAESIGSSAVCSGTTRNSGTRARVNAARNCPARVTSSSFCASAGISTGGPLSSSCAHSEPSSSGATARRTSGTVTVCVPIAGTWPRRVRRVASR